MGGGLRYGCANDRILDLSNGLTPELTATARRCRPPVPLLEGQNQRLKNEPLVVGPGPKPGFGALKLRKKPGRRRADR